MATEVELFEFNDIPSRPSIRGYTDSNGVAQLEANSVQLPQFSVDANDNVTGLVGPGGDGIYDFSVAYIDARNYGIFGDGGDYTTEIQNAIDTESAKLVSGYGSSVLVFPPGQILCGEITLRKVGLKGATCNVGTRLVYAGAASATWFSAHASDFNMSFWVLEGLNFRGQDLCGTVFDFTTYVGASPTIDVMFRLRDVHINNTLSHAIKIGGWINLHWEHLRFDHIGNGYAILATPGASLNLSTFTIDGFTYDHNRSVNKGWGVICVDSSADASNLGTIELTNGRIEVNATWAAVGALGALDSTRAIFTEILIASPTGTRTIGWNLRNVTYADASSMGDDCVVYRNSSGATSDFTPTLHFQNIRTSNLAKVFGGAIGTRMAGIPVSALTGIGAINVGSGAALTFGNSGSLFCGNGAAESTITASRGSIYGRQDGAVGSAVYIKETGDATNTGWRAILTMPLSQSLAYAASLAHALSSGNLVDVGALTGAITLGSPTGVPAFGVPVWYKFVQDGTGGRGITWSALHKGAWPTASGTANQKLLVRGYSDGTNIIFSDSSGWY